MKILLVEDSDVLRGLFARMLRRRGFEVREASDGRAALECLADFKPELILTDLMMPGLDGIGLIRHLKEIPELAAVPVVAMTAGDPLEAEREARSVGAANLLAKPLDSDTLLDCVGCYSG